MHLFYCVSFYTSASRKVLNVANVVGYDSFEFSMIDAEGRRSVPVTYSLTLTSPLFATATAATTMAPKGVEDTRAAVTVRIFLVLGKFSAKLLIFINYWF